MNSNWIFIENRYSHYWVYPEGVQSDMSNYFGRTSQKNISELVSKLAVL